jgi:hypothetical protein
MLNVSAFDDDSIIIYEKNEFQLNIISNNYNIKAAATESEVMTFKGKYPVRSTVILNDALFEQETNFNYHGCYVTCNDDINRFHNMWSYFKSSKEKARLETVLKCCKAMDAPVVFVLYCSESWTVKVKEWT